MNDPEFVRVALRVADTFDLLRIPYAIGGSLASVLHGIPRTTVDAHLVADLQPEQISPFVRALRDEFYVDPLAVLDAIQHRSSFNLSSREVLLDEPERTAWVTSAEDIILAKLEWFRMGGEVSETCWA